MPPQRRTPGPSAERASPTQDRDRDRDQASLVEYREPVVVDLEKRRRA